LLPSDDSLHAGHGSEDDVERTELEPFASSRPKDGDERPLEGLDEIGGDAAAGTSRAGVSSPLETSRFW
jgi:hypothetical protein